MITVERNAFGTERQAKQGALCRFTNTTVATVGKCRRLWWESVAKVTICDVNIAIAPHCVNFSPLPQLSPLLRDRTVEPAVEEKNAVVNYLVRVKERAAGIEARGQQC